MVLARNLPFCFRMNRSPTYFLTWKFYAWKSKPRRFGCAEDLSASNLPWRRPQKTDAPQAKHNPAETLSGHNRRVFRDSQHRSCRVQPRHSARQASDSGRRPSFIPGETRWPQSRRGRDSRAREAQTQHRMNARLPFSNLSPEQHSAATIGRFVPPNLTERWPSG